VVLAVEGGLPGTRLTLFPEPPRRGGSVVGTCGVAAPLRSAFMPIPDAPASGSDLASVVLAQLRQIHGQARAILDGLDAHGLCWVPAEDANSVAVLLVHLLGSEIETLLTVAGRPCSRDRDAEFRMRIWSRRELFELLEGADELVDDIGPDLTAGLLRRLVALPTLPADERRPGTTWLVAACGHAREHLGQMMLTAQLYNQAKHRAIAGRAAAAST